MRVLGRIVGATLRLSIWALLPPLGWYMSRSARGRRRHNETIRTIKASR